MVAVVSQLPAYHPGQPAPYIFLLHQAVGLNSAPFGSDAFNFVGKIDELRGIGAFLAGDLSGDAEFEVSVTELADSSNSNVHVPTALALSVPVWAITDDSDLRMGYAMASPFSAGEKEKLEGATYQGKSRLILFQWFHLGGEMKHFIFEDHKGQVTEFTGEKSTLSVYINYGFQISSRYMTAPFQSARLDPQA